MRLGATLVFGDRRWLGSDQLLTGQLGCGLGVKASRLAAMPQSQRRPMREAASSIVSTRPVMWKNKEP